MQRTQTSQNNSESGTYSCRQAGLDFKNCSKAAAIEEHGVGIQTDQQTSGWESPEMNPHIKDSCFLATAQAMAWKGLLPDAALAAAAGSWLEVGEDGRPRGPACTRASSAGRTMAPRLARAHLQQDALPQCYAVRTPTLSLLPVPCAANTMRSVATPTTCTPRRSSKGPPPGCGGLSRISLSPTGLTTRCPLARGALTPPLSRHRTSLQTGTYKDANPETKALQKYKRNSEKPL